MVNCKNYFHFCYLSSNLHKGIIMERKEEVEKRFRKGVMAATLYKLILDVEKLRKKIRDKIGNLKLKKLEEYRV